LYFLQLGNAQIFIAECGNINKSLNWKATIELQGIGEICRKLSDQPAAPSWKVALSNLGSVASAVPTVSSEYDELLLFIQAVYYTN